MLSFCGIDVSKDRLDVIVLPEGQCSSADSRHTGSETFTNTIGMVRVASRNAAMAGLPAPRMMSGTSAVLRPGFETPGWAYSGGQL